MPRHRPRFLIAVLVALVLAGLGFRLLLKAQLTPAPALRIAAASSLKFPLDEIVAAYTRRHPEAKLEVTYGSSGNFYAQLVNKAPFDVFLSADVAYPAKVIEQGLAAPDALFVYGTGKLVLWAPKGGLPVASQGARALTSAAARKIAIANPMHAPYGRATEEALMKLGIGAQVQDRLVFAENVEQAGQYAHSHAADAAFVALAWALAPNVAGQGEHWQVPEELHQALRQGGVVLKAATDPEGAYAFRDYLGTSEARAILQRYGFTTPSS